MRMLDLFSGIGGISLAAHWAGIDTVAFCEIEPFCHKVLNKHWPGIPIFEDVTKLTREVVENEIGADRIDIVAGGFPCQPFSQAGEKRGREDERHLWPEMLRIIDELRPDWVVGENVENFARMELGNSLTDLERIGYRTQSFIIPASSIGAPHQRNRVFIIANSSSKRLEGAEWENNEREGNGPSRVRKIQTWGNWSSEPGVGRVGYGIPSRVDRLKALGNAVVPQQIYPIFKAIMEIEEMSVRCK